MIKPTINIETALSAEDAVLISIVGFICGMFRFFLKVQDIFCTSYIHIVR
jgi:hypothetical protein